MFFFVIDRKFHTEQLIFCEKLLPVGGIRVYYNTLREYHGEFNLYKLYFGVDEKGMWKI